MTKKLVMKGISSKAIDRIGAEIITLLLEELYKKAENPITTTTINITVKRSKCGYKRQSRQ